MPRYVPLSGNSLFDDETAFEISGQFASDQRLASAAAPVTRQVDSSGVAAATDTNPQSFPGPGSNLLETTDAAANSSTAYAIGIGQTASGTLSTASDHDWYRVTLTAGQQYTVAMTGTGVNNVADTFLRVVAPDGATVILSDDDSLPGANSIATFTAGVSGTFFIDAGSFNNASAGTYGVSIAAGSRANFDLPMGAGVIDGDSSWSGTPGTGAVVTYGFRQSAASYTVNGHDISTFSQLTAAQIAAVEQILQIIGSYANITFQRVNPTGYTDNATILFGDYSDNADGSGAFAFFPGSTASNSSAGDVWLNNSVSRTSLPAGSYSFEAIMHEVGHTLGLSHPGSYNAAPGVAITYANHAQFLQDSDQYSLMSYFRGTETGANFGGDRPQSLMLFDVLALQNIYGANSNTRTGNTFYGYHSNAGGIYDFAANAHPALTIWDAGGVDALDLSGYAGAQTIDLRPGYFSSVDGLVNNVSIAVGTVIEVAYGGDGADVIYGNDVDNTLLGLGGDDLLFGGAGGDIMVGGAGNDIYYVDTMADQILENSGEGQDQSYATSHYVLAANVEWFIAAEGFGAINGVGTGSDNYMVGNASSNAFDGGAGNDALAGGAGDDMLYGGSGADTMHGGTGNDTYFVDSSGDVCLEHAGEGTDIVYSAAHFVLGPNIEWLVLQDAGGAINAIGSACNESIVGNSSANAIDGGSGNDAIAGGGGNDALVGGSGADILDGGVGNDFMYGGTEDDYFICDSSSDQVFENANEGLDWIYTTATFVMSANVDYLLMQGSGAIAALGNNLSNSIVGNGADNVIDGGAGNDSMIGCAGNDTFVFARGQADGDVVQDFAGNGAAAGDRIVFSGYGAGAAFGQLNATQWIVISGDGLTSEIINFINAAPIHSSDFIFV